jgi:hypothetical protein
VPSYTSSSDPALPSTRWGPALVVACATAAGILLPLEAFSRSHNLATGADAHGAWASLWMRTDPRDAVLLGSSRIQAGIDPGLLAAALGRPVRQLAVPGGSSLEFLEWLAEREEFRGVVLAEVMERVLFDAAYRGAERVARLRGEVAAAETSPDLRFRAWLRGKVERRWALPRAAISPRILVSSTLRGRMPDVTGLVMFRERSALLRLPPAVAAVRRRQWVEQTRRTARPVGDAEAAERTRRFGAAAARIAARGGLVVALRMPSSGEVRTLEEEKWPRAARWDRLAGSAGLAAIHFADHPELREQECPDGSHLDAQDVGLFTKALLEVLRRKVPGWPAR